MRGEQVFGEQEEKELEKCVALIKKKVAGFNEEISKEQSPDSLDYLANEVTILSACVLYLAKKIN